ncbi:Gfo/Idh/MocA family oxidoreductase [Microbispora sp. NPDC049125]|uniref:Gfo/Idh/MocA family oxidoreductase n=1 Tax=Microbispora sp. NPDC049125 TaxID=3154929 RepID=UPI0034655C74
MPPGLPAPLRVGLAGYGPAGSFFHAPLIAATPGLRLSAVVTRDAAKAERVRREHPGAEVVESAGELWGRADLVVVATPNRTHVPLATEALKAGLPVVVDKPLAGTAGEARELLRLAHDHGLMLSVFQNRRWDGDFLTLRRLLPRLGRVHRFESRFERWRPAPKGGWRETGGPDDLAGTLYDLGSHLVDQALQLFGPVSRVYAEADVRRAGVLADDDAFISLTHESGTRSQLWMSAVAGRLGPRFRVLGSDSAYVKWGLDPQEEGLRAGERPTAGIPWGAEPPERWGQLGAEGEEPTAVPTEPGAYQRFYEGVVACLRDGAPAPVTVESVVETLAVLEAARLSAANGQVVSLRG